MFPTSIPAPLHNFSTVKEIKSAVSEKEVHPLFSIPYHPMTKLVEKFILEKSDIWPNKQLL